MPLTPFHLGPALLLGLLFGLNLSVVLVASVLPDLEALYLLMTGTGQLHGFFHSYLGASVIAVVLGLAWPKSGKKNVFVSALVGAYSHVFLDSLLYWDVRPFWPMETNPFLGLLDSWEAYALSVILLVAGILFYAFKSRR